MPEIPSDPSSQSQFYQQINEATTNQTDQSSSISADSPSGGLADIVTVINNFLSPSGINAMQEDNNNIESATTGPELITALNNANSTIGTLPPSDFNNTSAQSDLQEMINQFVSLLEGNS